MSIGEKGQTRPKETNDPLIKLFKNDSLYSILTNKSDIFLQSYTDIHYKRYNFISKK